jgi:hypothetical protein
VRIAELHLERYGRFEDHRLVFAKRDADFHLVFGPNEAGKTTSLAALADLLFGFEHAVGYDFRFAASLLRVGAVLEQGAERLACRRRRGRQGTLVNDEDRPIDEARLTTMLSGQRRDAFLLSSSLDHARLRRGGQAMAESKDDLGQMLFAAGSGLIGLRTVLKNLDEDLEAIWGPRRSEKRSYTRAERALAEARTALREATLKPVEWGKARNDRDRLRAEHIAAEAARRRAASALAEVERLRRVYGAITRRAAFLAALATETAVLLPEPVEAAARQALQTAANEEQKRDAAQSLHAGVLERLEAEPADEAALALTERIEALVQKLGAEIDRREQRPRREEELQIRRAAAEAAAGRLGLIIGDDLSIALPTEADVARLRELVSRRAQLTARAESARDVVERSEAEVVRADSALAAAIIPEGLDALRFAVDAARRAGDLDARVDEERAAVAMGKSHLVDAIAALAPWTGDATALVRLAPPADAVIDAAKTELEKARSNAADARRTAAERNSELELVRARLERLSAGGEAVSAERLYLARSERDAALLSIRRHVEGIEALADPMGSIRRLEAAVQAADEVADVRFVAADASARLSQAEAEVAELTLRCEQAARHVEVAAEDAADRASAWADRLAAVNLPIAAPEDLRAWLARRGRALEARDRLAEAEGDFRAAWEARARTVGGLAAALGEPVPAADAAVAETFARAEARLAKLEEQARAVADSKRTSKEAH